MTRWFFRVARTILACYIAWVLAASSLIRTVVFPRQLISPEPQLALWIERLEELSLATPQGPVDMWFVPGDGVDERHPGPAVIFAHGNAELIEHQEPIINGYRRLGLSVLLPEYRGYGRSAGKPSQRAVTDDYTAAYDLLVRRKEVDASRVIFHGRSIGSGVVCALAEHRKPAGLILTSPMTSVRAMAWNYLIPGFLVPDPFDNDRVLAELNVPVLIQHGTHDEVIPLDHGRKLAAIAPGARWTEYGCGHNDFPVGSSRFWKDIAEYLNQRGILR
jgi:hypothetical protein